MSFSQSQQKKATGARSRAKLSSLFGKGEFPVSRSLQKKALKQHRALHNTAGYVARKETTDEYLAKVAKSLPTEQRFLWECMQILHTAFEASGFQVDAVSLVHETTRRRRLLQKWTELSAAISVGLPGAFKFMKYKLAAFFSAVMDVELPATPVPLSLRHKDNPMQVVSGRAARRFVARLKRDALDPLNVVAFQRKLTLAVNVLQSKKGFPRPNKAMLAESAKATFEELTTPPRDVPPVPVPWHLVTDENDLPAVVNWTVIESEVLRTVNEIFPANSYTDFDRNEPFFPSTSANYVSSRSDGGAVGAFFDELHQQRVPVVEPRSGLQFSVAEVDEESRSSGQMQVNDRDLRRRFAAFQGNVIDAAIVEQPVAKPVALAEALKVRVITKGPALIATAMKPLQRFLWKTLSQHRCFQLIGRPVDDRVLLHVLGASLQPGKKFLSGDYKNATNMLNSRISRLICRALSSRLSLSEEEAKLFETSLVDHIIEHDGAMKQQMNGQLMGSVTSFPVLCLANFVVCRLALELDSGKRLRTSSLPLLINGDDCLFKIGEEGKRLWERIAAFIGLEPSIGKCYYSDRFANVNSTNYAFQPNSMIQQQWPRPLKGRISSVCPAAPSPSEQVVVRMNPFVETKFINFGLLMGLKRSTGKIGKADLCDPIDGIGIRHRELLRSCPEESVEAVKRIFWRLHFPVFKDIGLPWFLPEWIGGLGLVGDQDEETLKLAMGAILNWSSWRQLPVKGSAAGTPWKVRQYCERKYLSNLPQSMLSEEQSQAEDQVLGLLCSSAFLDARTSLGDLYSQKDGMIALKQNGKFWKEVRARKAYCTLPAVQDVEQNAAARGPAFQRSLWTMRRPRRGVALKLVRDFSEIYSSEGAQTEVRLNRAISREMVARARVELQAGIAAREIELALSSCVLPDASPSVTEPQTRRGTKPPLVSNEAKVSSGIAVLTVGSPVVKSSPWDLEMNYDASELKREMSIQERFEHLASIKFTEGSDASNRAAIFSADLQAVLVTLSEIKEDSQNSYLASEGEVSSVVVSFSNLLDDYNATVIRHKNLRFEFSKDVVLLRRKVESKMAMLSKAWSRLPDRVQK